MDPLGESIPPTTLKPSPFLPGPFSNSTACRVMDRDLGRLGIMLLGCPWGWGPRLSTTPCWGTLCCTTPFLFALSRGVGVVGTDWGMPCCLTGEGATWAGALEPPTPLGLGWWCLRAEDEATLWTSETAS